MTPHPFATACVRLRPVWACLVMLVALFPAPAAGQQAGFAQAFADLTAAIDGTFGDEGALVRPAIDRMSSALAAWDREIDTAAADVRAALKNPAAGLADRRMSLGRMYADRGRLADARAEFDAASRLDPRRAEIHVLRGLVLGADGKPSEAIEAFRTARTLDPGNPVAAYYLFREASIHGSTKDALESASVLRETYAGLVKTTAGKKGAPFTRFSLLQPAAGRPPLIPPAGYSQAYRHIVLRDYEQAIVELRKAVDGDPLVADPASGSAAMARAIGALRKGRLSEARTVLSQSGLLANSSEAHRVLGLVYWAESDYDRSIAELTNAISRAPRNERARLALARVLNAAGRDDDSERALLETVRVMPDSVLAHWWLGRAYEQLNRFAEARQEIEQVAQAAVFGESQLHTAIGRFALGATDGAGAVDAFARSVRADPNDPEPHRFLAGALMQEDRQGEAFAEFVAALLIDPQDAAAHAGIGQIELLAGRDAEAIDALRRAIDLAPGNSEARYALATALERLGRSAEAAQHFARVDQEQRQMLAERRRTVSSDVLKEEAALRAAEGQFETAIALYEKALAFGADPIVSGRLADLYLKVGRAADAARARALSEKAGR